ncbi:MAG: hypothetical protein AAGF73_04405 [Actinomycetota bacterium]
MRYCEDRREYGQRVGVETTSDVAASTFHKDQAGQSKFLEVVRNGRGRDAEALSQVTNAHTQRNVVADAFRGWVRALHDPTQESKTIRIRQRSKASAACLDVHYGSGSIIRYI